MIARWMLPFVAGGMLLASCGEGGSRSVAIPLEASAPAGVAVELKTEFLPSARFSDVTARHPESSFAGAVVEGESFTKAGPVYLLTLTVKNGSSKAVALPRLLISRPDFPVASFIPGDRRGSVAAGAEGTLLYYWDPGGLAENPSARLEWSP